MRIRIAMATETPLHRQRRDRVDLRHEIDSPVAFGAADAVADVRGMIEIHEPRELVHPTPMKGLIVEPARADRLQPCRFLPNLAMAIHANARGRSGGVFRSRGFVMAIEAIDAVVANVVPVIEDDWLLDRLALLGGVRGPSPQDRQRRNDDDACGSDAQTQSKDGVRPDGEERPHRSFGGAARGLQTARLRFGARSEPVSHLVSGSPRGGLARGVPVRA